MGLAGSYAGEVAGLQEVQDATAQLTHILLSSETKAAGFSSHFQKFSNLWRSDMAAALQVTVRLRKVAFEALTMMKILTVSVQLMTNDHFRYSMYLSVNWSNSTMRYLLQCHICCKYIGKDTIYRLVVESVTLPFLSSSARPA